MALSSIRQRIQLQNIGDVAVVELSDQRILDEQFIQIIGDELMNLVDDLGRRKIVLNFANVDLMSSAMIGRLLQVNQRLLQLDGKLVICGLNANLSKAISLLRLDAMLTILKDLPTALQSF